MSIIANYHAIQAQIISLAKHYGRDPNEIVLVAASKGHSLEELIQLYDAGHRTFGESRLQEAIVKMVQAPDGIEWHFIGSLQKNKVRKVVEKFSLIHAVDTPELATKISTCSNELGRVSEILLQVNISGELSKHGLDAEEWRQEFDLLMGLPAIKIKGLMTMAPADANEASARSCFAKLREFRNSLKTPLPYLSMGMSQDYPWAIAEGATHLRIGTALFKA